MLLTVVALILVALIFDYINGFHDAANSIATVVSTRVLSPGKAVIWAAFFNFVAAFTFGTAVATTVGSGMIDIKIVTFAVIFGGLTGAIIWDLITWYYGLPTSSSHALIGGYAGAAVAKAGPAAITAGSMLAGFTMPLPIVSATCTPKKRNATKLKKAAHRTAHRGERTRVDTTVAIEFAASWKPLTKSKTSATRMMALRVNIVQACSRTTPSMMLATSSQRSVAFSKAS